MLSIVLTLRNNIWNLNILLLPMKSLTSRHVTCKFPYGLSDTCGVLACILTYGI